MAVPDRDQRLPRPALRPAAAGPADGPVGLAVAARRALPGVAAAGHGLGGADPRPPGAAGGRGSGRPRRRTRVDPAGLRGRAAAPAAAAARRPAAARRAALEGR